MYDLILYSITTSDGASVLMECQRDIAGQVLTDIKRFKIRKKVLISQDVIDPLTNTYMTVNHSLCHADLVKNNEDTDSFLCNRS